MSGTYPIMRSLDPYHQRVGYLGALALIAYRGLDTKDAIRARLDALLFNKVRIGSPECNFLFSGVPDDRRDSLMRLCRERDEEENPAAILYAMDERSDWLYTSEIWLHQECMPSPLGGIPRGKVDRVIDLARWTGMLTPTIELSESGFLLQQLLAPLREQGKHPDLGNPLCPSPRLAVTLLYLRLLLAAEMLWPSLVLELAERFESKRTLATRGENGLLRASASRLVTSLGPVKDPSDILDIRDVTDFQASIAAKPSTEENYLRPRLEILVDLGILGRAAGKAGSKDAFPWIVTPRTLQVAQQWAQLNNNGNHIPEYLDSGFFTSMAHLYQPQAKRVNDARQVLLWFDRAFRVVGREVGFTPGRTIALMACMMAIENGVILEVKQVFDNVYEAAKSEWAEYLRFSGGSRFDREFMIQIRQGLGDALAESLQTQPEVKQ